VVATAPTQPMQTRVADLSWQNNSMSGNIDVQIAEALTRGTTRHCQADVRRGPE
jgi:hypothetical protein